MTLHRPQDRRQAYRASAAGITVALRPKGRLGTIAAKALDFNRHGMAVHTDTPLAKDRVVYLCLRCGETRLDNLVGVVHNCVRQGSRYRSGILFRLSSQLQYDRAAVAQALAELEASLAGAPH